MLVKSAFFASLAAVALTGLPAALAAPAPVVLELERDVASGNISVPDIVDGQGNIVGRATLVMPHEKRSTSPTFNFGSQQVRGVNIGGWLVAEPFITPSLFESANDDRVVDEYTMGQYLGTSKACSLLSSHWSSWITEDDFRQIAAAGLNFVRIPIGFWAFNTYGAPYCKSNQFDYLTSAVGWAAQYGIKVMVDLHGAPQSQNGFDNSGHRGTVGWFSSQTYATQAKAAISTIASRFTESQYKNTVVAIQLVNEPLTTSGPSNALSFTQSYYQDAYYTVRYAQGSTATGTTVSIHDGFQALSVWSNFMQEPTFSNVLLDHHEYSVFSTSQLEYSQTQRLNNYCTLRSQIKASQPHLWTIVGEWTSANTDCAKWLNGRGIGARYDGSYSGSSYIGSCTGKSGSGSSFSSSYKAQLKQLFDTQRSVYSTGSGWIYWAWKMENAADWSYQDGLTYGWITSNLNNAGNVEC